ncbi:MAG: hypothetical protein AAGI23_14150 [Bacteroidota bacterium]
MFRIFITSIILLLSTALFSQNISIEISSSLLRGDRYAVVLTTSEGKAIHQASGQISEEDLIFVDFQNPYESERIDLTIITEENRSEVSYYGHTFLNVKDGDFITRSFQKFVNHKYTNKINLNIENVNSVDEVVYHQADWIDFTLSESNVLDIEVEHLIGTDLYLPLKCNDEEEFRYAYISLYDVKPNMTLNWDSLYIGVDTQTIDLFDTNDWLLDVYANSNVSGRECYFYKGLVEGYNSQLEFLLPRHISFKYFVTQFDANTQADPYQLGPSYALMNDSLTAPSTSSLDDYTDFLRVEDQVGFEVIDNAVD